MDSSGLIPTLGERGRHGILALILISLTMMGLELTVAGSGSLALVQLARAVTLIGCLGAFLFTQSGNGRVWLLHLSTAVMALGATWVGVATLDWGSHTLMVCALAMGAGVLLPWPWRQQVVCCSILLLSWLTDVALVQQQLLARGGEVGSPAHMIASMICMMLASVYLAYSLGLARKRLRARLAWARQIDIRSVAYDSLVHAVAEAQLHYIAESERDEVLRSILAVALKLTGAEVGFVAEVVEQDGKQLWTRPVALPTEPSRIPAALHDQLIPLETEGSLIGRAVLQGAAVVRRVGEPLLESGAWLLPEAEIENAIAVPALLGGEAVGVVLLVNAPQPPDGGTAALLEPFVVSAAQLISADRAELKRRSAEAEVSRLNAELEARVECRTLELAEANRELQLSNRELMATNGDLEGFSYSISHDLRGALRVIDGLSRLLEEEYSEVLDEQGRGYIARICAGAARMGGLTDSLLALSRVGRSEIRLEDVDLSQTAAEVAKELATMMPDRKVEVEIDEGATAFVDRGLVRVVLANLFGNAWKFTAGVDPARVEFRVEPSKALGSNLGDDARIFSVRDNGPGFPEDDCERIFAAFERLDAAAKVEGSGIGLATVKRAVERHGGQVWARSAPGSGATFYFSLPSKNSEHVAA